MSDLARWWQIRPASPQLPVSWYFDPEIFALEKKLLFDAGAMWAGGKSRASAASVRA